MRNELSVNASIPQIDPAILKNVMIGGDLSKLTDEQQLQYYNALCESLNLNPLTRPFEFITLNEKLTLYCRKDGASQLRSNKKVSTKIIKEETRDGIYIVHARATTPDGRREESIGAVSTSKEGGVWKTTTTGKKYLEKNGQFVPIQGDALADLIMKAETKAKRRATLDICGLGMPDESEIDSRPNVRDITPEKPLSAPTNLKPTPADITRELNRPPEENPVFVFKELDGMLTEGMDANEAILYLKIKINSLQTLEDITLYEVWKELNSEMIMTFFKANRRAAVDLGQAFKIIKDLIAADTEEPTSEPEFAEVV